MIAIIGMLIALLLPAVQAAREAGRRTTCSSNLRELALAVHNYHDVHHELPPASSERATGTDRNQVGWSWLAHIAPYIEQANWARGINWRQRPQGATNVPVVNEFRSGILMCPSRRTLGPIMQDPTALFGLADRWLGAAVPTDYASVRRGTWPGGRDGMITDPLTRPTATQRAPRCRKGLTWSCCR